VLEEALPLLCSGQAQPFSQQIGQQFIAADLNRMDLPIYLESNLLSP
jgi:hypothetical protein